MNCNDVRTELPQLLTHAFDEATVDRMQEHLAACAGCRKEWAELQQLARLLDARPVPQINVDLARLYRDAAVIQRRATRHWRWLGLAASIVLLIGGSAVLLSRLELRITANDVTLRWGAPPAAPKSEPSAPTPYEAQLATQATKSEDDLEVVSQMIHALAQEIRLMDARQRQSVAAVDSRIGAVEEQSLRRWLTLERTVNALYVLSQKGE